MTMKSRERADDLHQSICACLPYLRAFSMSLARDRPLADDLVQEAIVRALTFRDQFEPNTNFKAWIATITRNCFYNEQRRRRWISDVSPELPSLERPVSGDQEARLEMRDFERAFGVLVAEHREALLLVGANGLSYEDASKAAGCAVGTMKSRVSRARAQLQHLLDPEMSEPATANRKAGAVFREGRVRRTGVGSNTTSGPLGRLN
jgi:RNA polymerase sigma-70 factor (ECF subfamily)